MEKKKLHIGCGEKYLHGYLHVDARDYPHVDFVTYANNLHMFNDETVDEIYACHILEHFGRHEVVQVLDEWCRILKVGGEIRLAVPDFEAIVVEYIENKTPLDTLLGLLYGGQNYEHNFHYQAYDLKRLSSLLKDAGFGNIKRYDWNEFLPEGFDDYSRAYLPHMDFETGRLMSLNIIATKNSK